MRPGPRSGPSSFRSSDVFAIDRRSAIAAAGGGVYDRHWRSCPPHSIAGLVSTASARAIRPGQRHSGQLRRHGNRAAAHYARLEPTPVERPVMLKRIDAGVLSVAYEETGDRSRHTGAASARLSVRRARLRRGGTDPRLRRMPGDRPLSARVRADALSVGRHAAFGPAGGAGQRPPGSAGCPWDLARRAGRLRLGRARRLHRGGAVAGAGARAGHGRRLQHPGHRGREQAAATGERVSPLVPVLLPRRARPRRPRAESARAGQAAVEAVVAQLALRRCDLRAHRGILRQPGLRARS